MTVAYLDLMIMLPAFLAGMLVLSTHIPLGHEVLKRGIIFIDLAIAQIAALGVIAATVLGGELANWQIQFFAGLSAILGALFIYSLEKTQPKSLEALIGILFIVAASGGLLLISHSPHSDELLHDLLIGQILWANEQQLMFIAALYCALLLAWFSPLKRQSVAFYIIFSLTVTASVQLVGVYLVFASLIIPALACYQINNAKQRFIIAYCNGLLAYIIGIIVSYHLDLPTGAVIVWALVITSLLTHLLLKRQPNLIQ